MNVLVSVSGFSEDVEGKRAVILALDVDVQHVNEAIGFLLFGPFYLIRFSDQPLSLSFPVSST